MHYGVLRRSGRYPWGSGGELLETVGKLGKQGLSEKEIADSLGISTGELRNQKALAATAEKEASRLNVIRQKERGMSIAAISRETGIPASTIRDLLKPDANMKFRVIKEIADLLRKLVDRDRFIDVGDGSEVFMGVSRTKLENAIALLKNEGHTIHYLRQEQLGTGRKTSIMVLGPKDATFKDVVDSKTNIGIPNIPDFYTKDGVNFIQPSPINNMSSKRIQVRWAEDGGTDKDGLIEMRAGVPELSLGGKGYAQVRIGVDGSHFMKGMAIERTDLPPGVDIIYNVSKPKSSNKLDAMKPQIEVGASRFGAVVKPNTYLDKNGKEQFGHVNILGEGDSLHVEGNWSKWNRNLASQVLSKQAPRIAAKQLDIAYENSLSEFSDISTLTNPTVRKHLLLEFADSVDRRAVDLKAAALPRQSTNVLLPDPTIKPTEIYAPNYRNGEQVSLIRYPHGGVFEIPTLTVNNKVSDLKDIIGATAADAVAIHPDVAARLSGADFDGDTAVVIPNRNKTLRTAPALEGLKGFDPKSGYPKYPGMKVMSEKQKQLEMGKISNLITDMTIKGASESEIARAVRHSMVVIDARNHKLNYKQSEADNAIGALKKKYQGSARSGASTLISRTTSEQRVPERRDHYSIDPKTGQKVFTYTNESFINKKTGMVVTKELRSTKGYEALYGDGEGPRSAHKLSSGTAIERVYANHADRMRDLGNKARLATLSQDPTPYDRKAKATYAKEVDSLEAKYKAAVAARPIERRAQLVGGAIYDAKLKANPDMTAADKQKEKGRSIALARTRLEAGKPTIAITPREWEAIEMGAISPTRLTSILRNSDMDQVRAHATPRALKAGLSTSKVTRAKALIKGGYTAAEIASALGVPVSQIQDIDK
jgi:transcriptional regulator with XRE-family HTH domain